MYCVGRDYLSTTGGGVTVEKSISLSLLGKNIGKLPQSDNNGGGAQIPIREYCRSWVKNRLFYKKLTIPQCDNNGGNGQMGSTTLSLLGKKKTLPQCGGDKLNKTRVVSLLGKFCILP